VEKKTMPEESQNQSNEMTQNKKPKSEIVSRISRIVRRYGLDYEGWRYVSKRVRKECDLKPAKKGRRLPKILTNDDFHRFFEVLDRSDNTQHSLMLRLLFYTGVRVSELCNTQVSDVDLESCRVRINEGKGGKDRTVLFSKSFSVALRTHIASHSDNRWLFQTRRNTRYSTRRVQQIVALYAEKAGVKATPHTFRHQCITWLTRRSGLADAELQILSGHSRRDTIALYQHLAVSGDLEAKYQEAMKDAGV
jgi:integrase/recombinase XerD